MLVGGREIYREPVPEGDACGLLLTTNGSGSTVTAGGAPARSFPGDRVRSVRVFATELAPPDAAGLTVQARTADWFTADATGTKDALATAAVLLAAASLALLALADLRRRRRRAVAATLRLWRARAAESWLTVRGVVRKVADVAVLVVLGVWTVIGPLSPDDGFTEGIVRNAAGTDQFGNFYRWENASEAPFTLVLRLIQPMVDDAASPLALRSLSTLAGVAVWLLVSRVALPVLLGRYARRVWVRLLLAACLLVWWMPFDLGVRPEPFAALAVTATVACGLRAAARPRHGGVWLGLAALAFGVSLSVTPSSVMVLGPVLVLLPALLRRLRGTATGVRGVLAGAGGAAAAAAIGGVGLVVMFTGQSWYTVTRSTEMHAFYGPNVPWFDEVRRYSFLLGFDSEQGGMGRRIPVLLTLALLVAVLPLLARGVHRTAGLRWVPVVTAGAGLGLLVLWLSPSKWTHYFGTLAGVGAAGLACGAVVLVLAARRRADEAAVRAAAGAGALALVVGAAVAFSGKNDWFLYSHWGVPHDDGPFRPWNSPVPWVLVVVAVLAVAVVAGLLRGGVGRAVRRADRVGPGRADRRRRGRRGHGDAVVVLGRAGTPGGQLLGRRADGRRAGREADLRAARRRRRRPGHARRGARGRAGDGGARRVRRERRLPRHPARAARHRQLAVPVGLQRAGLVLHRIADQPVVRAARARRRPGARPRRRGPDRAGQLPEPGVRPARRRRRSPARDHGDRRHRHRPGRAVRLPVGPGGRAAAPGPSEVARGAPVPRRDPGRGRARPHPGDRRHRRPGRLAGRHRASAARPHPGPRRDRGLGQDVRGLVAAVGGAVRPQLSARRRRARHDAGRAAARARRPRVLRGRLVRHRDRRCVRTDVGSTTRRPRCRPACAGTEGRPRYDDWGSLTTVTYPYDRDAYDKSGTSVERWGWEGDRTPLGYPEIPVP